MAPIQHASAIIQRSQQLTARLSHTLFQRDASTSISSTLPLRIRQPSAHLFPRQDSGATNGGVQTDATVGTIIPTTYVGQNSDLGPGAVAGIVIGAILGFLLFCFVVAWACGAQQNTFSTADAQIEVRDRRARSPRRRSRRSSGTYDAEIRVSRDRTRSPPRRTHIVEERVVEERIPMGRSRGPSPRPGPPPPPPPPAPVNVIVEDRRPRRHSEDEMVEVIEEEEDSEYSTLPSRRRSSRRRSGGYTREVDPNRYAGGDYPRRSVRRYD